MSKAKPVPFVNALKALLEAPPVKTFISRCPTIGASESPVVDLIFTRFREDEPDVEALAEFLAHQIINYVIPLKKRREVLAVASSNGGADFALMDRLRKQAKMKFIEFQKSHPGRASEVGELLAYLLSIEYLGAFQVASKMALKTSGNMPVYGLDGIHARFENEVMTLYFLESKISQSAADGIGDYVVSMKEFASKRKQYLLEYSVIEDLSNLDALDSKNHQLALEYFDVYGEMKAHRIERSVGVICFSEPKLFKNKLPKSDATPPNAHELHFSDVYGAEKDRFRKLFSGHLAKGNLDPISHRLFLFAVPDKDRLRELFNKELQS